MTTLIPRQFNCLYFPTDSNIPSNQLIDSDLILEDYMIDRSTSIHASMSHSQRKTCQLLTSTVKNDGHLYIVSCDDNFVPQLTVWLDEWSRIEGNTTVNIILNLAFGAEIHRLLPNDDLLVKPLFRLITWMKGRGVRATIGLPLAYGFYPLQYDVHVINGIFPEYSKVVTTLITLRSWTTRSRMMVIENSKLTVYRQPEDIDIINEMITEIYQSSINRLTIKRVDNLIRLHKMHIVRDGNHLVKGDSN